MGWVCDVGDGRGRYMDVEDPFPCVVNHLLEDGRLPPPLGATV